MSLETPVLFLIYNRPDTTREVFEAIRQARPCHLFVCGDGPNPSREKDAERVRAARAIAAEVDWDCEVKTWLRDENLGCKRGVSSAIDWFFSQVEEGIILEDDCLPSQSFFPFCQELLGRFREDSRVMLIGGANIVARKVPCDESYYFTKYDSIWGWASWRRAWRYYDVTMASWPEVKRRGLHKAFCSCDRETVWREEIFDRTYAGEIATWDYQWSYSRLVQSGLTAMCAANLVTNVGFGPEATHTKGKRHSFANMPREELTLPLTHPSYVLPCREAEEKYLEAVLPSSAGKNASIFQRLFAGWGSM